LSYRPTRPFPRREGARRTRLPPSRFTRRFLRAFRGFARPSRAVDRGRLHPRGRTDPPTPKIKRKAVRNAPIGTEAPFIFRDGPKTGAHAPPPVDVPSDGRADRGWNPRSRDPVAPRLA